jgi:arylsulfatase A-like enzyme
VPPNIILITWHDAGDWFGRYGNRHVHTPNVDRLAGRGATFTNTFSACSICSPSRAAIATGRYCQDNGVMFLANRPGDNRLHPHEHHIARLLRDAGYHTALFGVQHECAHEHVDAIMRVHEKHLTDPWPPAPDVADQVVPWLRERAGTSEPFYAQIGLFEAHVPFDFHGCEPDREHGVCIPPYLADTELTRNTVAGLQGMLRRGDEAIGRILTALGEAGLEDDTIVAMCVDHGVQLPRAKTTGYDAGHKVAWLLRRPGAIPPATRVDALTAHVDFLPTVFDLAALPTPGNVQGRSFADHARGESAAELNDCVFGHFVEVRRMVRTRTHKLIRNFREPGLGGGSSVGDLVPEAAYPDDRPLPHVELYDLREDPHEFRNLAGDSACAGIRRELDVLLWDFLVEHDDFIVHEPVRTEWQQRTRADFDEYRRGCTA